MGNRGLILAFLLLAACGEVADEETTPALPDTLDVATSQPGDASDASDTSIGPVERVWSHRAIGGVSMGAASVNIALGSEEHFDLAAGLGGYIDLRYMMTASHRLQLAGFCPLEQLEANLDSLNDPDAPALQGCGPMPAIEELEFA